ncbi:MAG: RNA polymerase factor sigma-54 [Spirochaetaceae bacterium]|nr:RNA polymerase factor sigma-54 [Spirochaetaceae bacterium]
MQFQKPVLRQEMKLKMSPQLLQSINLLALPLQNLKLKIKEEVEKNPALEFVNDNQSLSFDEIVDKKKEDYDPFENSSDSGYSYSTKWQGSDNSKRQFMEGTISRDESLQDHLISQLHIQPLSEREIEIGELLIYNLDDNGFNIEPPEVLTNNNELETLNKVKSIVQQLDPIGTCTTDYIESLIVQTDIIRGNPEGTKEVIRDYLDLLNRGKYLEISKKTGISLDDIDDILYYIKYLEPFPGRQFSYERPSYVIPDLIVKKRDGDFFLTINEEEIPILQINSYFEELIEQKDKSDNRQQKEINRFVNSTVRDAKWFMNTINLWNSTLLKTARAIVEFQRDFFRKGPKYLVPLTLKDIANEIDMNESTVSRISRGKYIQTEWGVFELKYFFTNAVSSGNSKTAVKEIIKEIIEESKSEKKLSDQKISDLLKMRGINIARRTVAKYRKELDIMPSFRR